MSETTMMIMFYDNHKNILFKDLSLSLLFFFESLLIFPELHYSGDIDLSLSTKNS